MLGAARSRGRTRKHPEPKVGDVYGGPNGLKVVKVLGRGHRGRSDLRVRVECRHGKQSDTYEYNLRGRGACGCERARGGAR